jgi:hypothetical protein
MYYADELRRLHQEIARKRRGKLTQGTTMIQRTHRNFDGCCGFEIPLHPQYYPDFAPSYFYLFPKLKTKLCGRPFGSNEVVI